MLILISKKKKEMLNGSLGKIEKDLGGCSAPALALLAWTRKKKKKTVFSYIFLAKVMALKGGQPVFQGRQN